jgi:hypothetical protein
VVLLPPPPLLLTLCTGWRRIRSWTACA